MVRNVKVERNVFDASVFGDEFSVSAQCSSITLELSL